MQPGQTINPDGTTDKPQSKPVPTELPQPEQQQQPSPATNQAPEPAQSPTPPEENNSFKYSKQDWSNQPEADDEVDPSKFEQETVEAEWTASEYVHNQKGAGWFMALGAIAGVMALLVYLITQDLISVVVAVVVTALFGATAAKKPQTLKYRITNRGLYIENKLYTFNDIRSFSVSDDGAVRSIHLTPLRRFIPPLTVYYPPENENDIIQALGNHIPHEEHRVDPIDRLMKRIRF